MAAKQKKTNFARKIRFEKKWDHVYFVHPSTDISVDISVDISTDTRPMYWSTYRPSAYRHVGRHIGRVSFDMSTAMCRSTYRPMCQPRYRPSDGWHIDQLSADISADIAAGTRPIRWTLIVGGLSVDRWWYIGQKLRLYKLYSFHPFGQPQKFLKASCLAFMCRKFSRYQVRHSSEILPNTQNTVDRKVDKDGEG